MEIKLIASDMDDTLLNKDCQIVRFRASLCGKAGP